MFGETVSFAESLQVTVLGMGVVFLVLVMLMYIIKIMEKVLYRSARKNNGQPEDALPGKSVEVPAPAPATVTADTGSELELVAVIAAAAAAGMGISPSDLVIRNIVRMPETAPIWSLTGRSELMASRSIKH
jgi:sodium pump decarboxylase gamma subunit